MSVTVLLFRPEVLLSFLLLWHSLTRPVFNSQPLLKFYKACSRVHRRHAGFLFSQYGSSSAHRPQTEPDVLYQISWDDTIKRIGPPKMWLPLRVVCPFWLTICFLLFYFSYFMSAVFNLGLKSAIFSLIPIFASYIYVITPGDAHTPFSHKSFAQLCRNSQYVGPWYSANVVLYHLGKTKSATIWFFLMMQTPENFNILKFT